MNAHALRYWLLRKPQPSTVRAFNGDKVSELTKGANTSWSEIAHSLEALEPERLEVFDDTGRLLRAVRFDDEEVEAAAAGETAKGKMPTYDAETERMKVFATLLAGAYNFAVTVAFEKLTDMLQSNVAQTSNLWRTLEQSNKMMARLNQEIVDNALEAAEERATNADPITGLVGHFIAGQSQGMAEAMTGAAKANGAKANGKGQI